MIVSFGLTKIGLAGIIFHFSKASGFWKAKPNSFYDNGAAGFIGTSYSIVGSRKFKLLGPSEEGLQLKKLKRQLSQSDRAQLRFWDFQLPFLRLQYTGPKTWDPWKRLLHDVRDTGRPPLWLVI